MSHPVRICFQLRVKPELLAEYIERHTPVWPDMLAEIAAAAQRNYSLFLADGGRLIGYCRLTTTRRHRRISRHPP